MGDFCNALLFQNSQYVIEILVDVPAFIERRALGIAHDTFDSDTAQLATDRFHLFIYVVVPIAQRSLRMASAHDSAGSVIDGTA